MSSIFNETERGYIYYNLAKEYYEENGHLIVPKNYKVGKYNLGSWLCEQRIKYKKGKLSKQKIELLNDIGMIWNLNSLEVRKYKFFNTEITYINKSKYNEFLLEKLKKILIEYKKEEINKEILDEINKKMVLSLE